MKTFLRALIAGLLLIPFSSFSEDVDLFVGTPPATTDLPNVLIILDNTANWSTPFTNEIAALNSVVSSLPANNFKLGLMMFTETGSGNSGADGAYVRAAVRPLTTANKTLFQNLVASFNKNNDKSNGGKIGQSMREAYLYFANSAPYAGNNKAKADYTGNNSGTAQSNAIYALTGNALASKSATTYTGPVISGGCAKNFIIYISNGAAQDNSSDTSNATTALSGLSGNTTLIPLSPSGSQDNVADEWARFMKNSSLGIVTYAIDIDKVTTGQGPGWTALLKSMSRGVGGGKYFDVSSATSAGAQIADALNQIFTEIQAVNSVFASVSLPVSVNTQGTYLNQVYIGMFRPDENSQPRWAGNLKQYKLGYATNSTTLQLLDAAGTGAINAQTGFITECARSFWTPSSLDTYWTFKPQGSCLTVANSNVSNYPDGNIVEKGGQAYKLRSTTTRTVKTCAPSLASCTALTDFATTNSAITNTLLGVTAGQRDALINWARGMDLNDENTDDSITPSATTSTVMRPSVHGDVVHSRPVAINYGTDTAPQVVVFYGGNDGVLRAVNGNRTSTFSTVAAGAEFWSFMPPEFYPYIDRLRSNTVPIYYPSSTAVGATRKNYGFDGSMASYVSASAKYLYATMRRGGRALYAFDVTTAGSPTLKWKRGCDSSSCSTGFSAIGQTWSTPKIITAAGYGSGASPIVVMGGGYDTCEDNDPNTCSTPTGNKIYIMDANTGALLNTFTTSRSVVADTTAVVNSSGNANYLYTADLGGNIYRISGSANAPIGAVDPSLWVMTKIASLGCATTTSCTNNRKFMFAPDVVVDGTTNVLLIGSGDREKPLTSFTNAASVTNYFFMLRDQPETTTWLSDESATCSGNLMCMDSLASTSADGTNLAQASVDAKKGWRMQLNSTEQVVTSAITVFGVVTYSTHTPAVPTSGQCSNLGTAKVYNVNYLNASPSYNTRYSPVSGGGLPPSPVAGMVTLDDGTTVPFVIGADPSSALEVRPPPAPDTATQPKARIFWNIVK